MEANYKKVKDGEYPYRKATDDEIKDWYDDQYDYKEQNYDNT